MAPRYTYRSRVGDTTYTDEGIVCPHCGEYVRLNDVHEQFTPPLDNTDAAKYEYTCVNCEKVLKVTMMIACWRTMVVVKKSNPPSPPQET